MTDRTIRLSDAIEAVKAKGIKNVPPVRNHDFAYQRGIDAAIEALSALPAVEGATLNPCRDCGGEPSESHSFGIARNGFEVECSRSMEFGLACFATGLCATKADAARSWNARSPTTSPLPAPPVEG